MVFAELAGPLRKFLLDLAQHIKPRFKLHDVALAVVKRDGFNALIFGEGLGQTSRGILTA